MCVCVCQPTVVSLPLCSVVKGALLRVDDVTNMNRHRQEDRQNVMERNAEYMHSLAAMETVLDEELERLDSEYHWDCQRYIYLQALECDSVHLHHLAITLQRSQLLTGMLRTLLEDTFEEKNIFIEHVQKQQEIWRLEDEQLAHRHGNQQQEIWRLEDEQLAHRHGNQQQEVWRLEDEQLAHRHGNRQQENKHKIIQNANQNNLCVKQKKKYLISKGKVKSRRSRKFSLNHQMSRYINIHRRERCHYKRHCNINVLQLTRSRTCVSRAFIYLQNNSRYHVFEEDMHVYRRHLIDQRQQEDHEEGVKVHHLISQQQNKRLYHFNNDIINLRHMNSPSTLWLHPTFRQQLTEMENDTQGQQLAEMENDRQGQQLTEMENDRQGVINIWREDVEEKEKITQCWLFHNLVQECVLIERDE